MKGVNLICTKDNFYQEFIFDGEEFKQAKYDWLRRVDHYYAQKNISLNLTANLVRPEVILILLIYSL